MIYDVIVIGAGGAGLSAAIQMKKRGLNVAVISKVEPTSSQTSQAQGGINAVLNQDDDINLHINDTLKSSQILEINKLYLLCVKMQKIL